MAPEGRTGDASETETSKKRKERKSTVERPKRPLTAYNFFYRYQRARLLAAAGGDIAAPEGAPVPPLSSAGSDASRAKDRLTEEVKTILAENPHAIDNHRRRSRRKRHGLAGFQDLVRHVSHQRRRADERTKDIFREPAREDMARNWRQMKAYHKAKARKHREKQREEAPKKVESEGAAVESIFRARASPARGGIDRRCAGTTSAKDSPLRDAVLLSPIDSPALPEERVPSAGGGAEDPPTPDLSPAERDGGPRKAVRIDGNRRETPAFDEPERLPVAADLAASLERLKWGLFHIDRHYATVSTKDLLSASRRPEAPVEDPTPDRLPHEKDGGLRKAALIGTGKRPTFDELEHLPARAPGLPRISWRALST